MPFASRFGSFTEGYSVVSLRALAAWRLSLGAVTLYFLATYARWIDVFYLESGVYPSRFLEQRELSPLSYFSSDWPIYGFVSVTFLLATSFTLGLPWVKFALPFFVAAIFQRAPIISTGASAVIQLSLVLCWMLPVEDDLSVANWLRTKRFVGSGYNIRTFAYPLVLLQIAVIYAFNAANKWTPTWKNGSAVARALRGANDSDNWGAWIGALPDSVLAFATYGTLLVEGVLPLLLLSPVFVIWSRRGAAFLMLVLHATIGVLLEVGTFSWAMLAFLPLLVIAPAEIAGSSPPRPETWQRPARGFAIAAFLYVMAHSLGRHDNPAGVNHQSGKGDLLPLPSLLRQFYFYLNLHQGWAMFSHPYDRSLVLTTFAETQTTTFDPWRQRAAHNARPLTILPEAAYEHHQFNNFERSAIFDLHLGESFPNWVLAQHSGDPHPVERFASFALTIPNDANYRLTLGEIERRSGLAPITFGTPLPSTTSGYGVFAAVRATDGRLVNDGSHVLNPTGSAFAPGCSHLLLDLQSPRTLVSALLQADAIDAFLVETSHDGKRFKSAFEFDRVAGRQYRTRIVNIEPPLTGIRFVRLRPRKPRPRRGFVAEFALFDSPLTVAATIPEAESHFVANHESPGAFGMFAGTASGRCPWDSDLN